ncbi:MAG: acyl carrier protein [Pseudomonadota bacterium]
MTAMTDAELETLLTEYITKEFLYDKPQVVLTNDLNIIEQRLVDSMDIFRLIQFIEKETGIIWEPEEMVQTNFKTINAIKTLALKKLAE